MKKQAATATTHTFAQIQKLFQLQVEEKTVKGQRPHHARLEAGKAKHIAKVSLTQSVLHAVERRVKGVKMGLDLVDGNHRILQWLRVGGCPFDKLLLITYVVDGRDENEAYDLATTLMRTLDSSNAAKSAVDFFTGAVLDAGLKPTSNAYKVGFRAATYFRRVVGSAKHMSDRQLAEGFYAELPAHRILDSVFAFSENRLNMSDKQAQAYFNPAVAIALFQFLEGRGRLPAKVSEIITGALLLASKRVKVSEVSAESVKLAKTLKTYCTEENIQSIKAVKSIDGFYSTLAAQLAEGLQALESVVPKKRKVV